MDCSQRFDLLLGYTSGDLSAREKAEVEEHLRTCPECAERLARLMDAESCIRAGVREPVAAPDLADVIMAGLQPVPARPFRRLTWAWTGACAAAAAVAFAGWLWWNSDSQMAVTAHDPVHRVRHAPNGYVADKPDLPHPPNGGTTTHRKPKPTPPHSPNPRPIRRPIFVYRPGTRPVAPVQVAKSNGRPGPANANGGVSGSSGSSDPVLSVPVTGGEVRIVERPVPVNKHETWRPPLEPELEDGRGPIRLADAGRGG